MDALPGGAAADQAAVFPAFELIGGDPAAGLLLLCDHASSAVPPAYDGLGLAKSEFTRHIAYDIGAAAVTRRLATLLGAPAVLSTYSRLLIDPNRGEDDPTLIMRLSDGAVVPGNAWVDAAERERRIALFHAPYHAAIDAAIDRGLRSGHPPALVSIHSFTPIWRGTARKWQVGILWDSDPRLALPLIAALATDQTLTVGDNEPYRGALANDCMYKHGTQRGLAHVLIEIRQDLIASDEGASAWAERLAPILLRLNALPDIHDVHYYGSLTGPIDPI